MRPTRLQTRLELILYGSYFALGVYYALPIWGAKDFASFYASGQAAGAGMDPYGIYPLTFFVESPWFTGFNQNLNPPAVLPLFEALSAMPLMAAFWLWWSFSVLCLVGLIWLLWRTYRASIDHVAVLWMLALGATWDTLHLGQIYLPLALAACVAWMLLQRGRHEIVAGLLIGVVAAAKPNFLVWPVLLFLSGYYRPSLSAIASAAVLTGIPLAIYGPEVYAHWAGLIAADGERPDFPTNGSLLGLFSRMDMAGVGKALSLALLAAIAWWAFARRPTRLEVSGCALVVSLLASPIGWGHYSLFLLPVLISAWDRRGAPGTAACIMLAIPLGMVASVPAGSTLVGLTIGSLYFWAFVLVLVLVFSGARPGSVPSTPFRLPRRLFARTG